MRSLLALLSAAAVAASSPAAFTLQERTTAMDVFYTFGGGSEFYPGSNSTGSTSLTGDNSMNLSGLDSGSGMAEFGLWEASVSYDLNQQYSVMANGWESSADITLNSFFLGEGFANIASNAPGNQQILLFTNDSTTAFTISGATTGATTAKIDLEFLDGVNWTSIYTTGPDGGGFSHSGVLGVGTYRLTSLAEATAVGQMTQGAAWSYSFAAVPEPGTMAVLALGLAAIRRRRRG